MGLATLVDIETALGRELSPDEEPKVQWYIDAVSAYIEREVGRKFSLHEDQTLTAVADSHGIIEIANLQEVSSVQALDPWTGVYGSLPYYLGESGYAFNGIDMIYGLTPHVTYKIVCSYGISTVPLEIKDMVVLLVLAGAGLDATAVNGLKSYRVGDVEEFYGVGLTETGVPAVTLTSLMRSALTAWNAGTTTYRI